MLTFDFSPEVMDGAFTVGNTVAFGVQFEYEQADGTIAPFPITGYTFAAKLYFGSAVYTGTVTVYDAANSIVLVQFAQSDTNLITGGFATYTLTWTTPAAAVQTVVVGTLAFLSYTGGGSTCA